MEIHDTRERLGFADCEEYPYGRVAAAFRSLPERRLSIFPIGSFPSTICRERKCHIAGFCWGQLPYLWLSLSSRTSPIQFLTCVSELHGFLQVLPIIMSRWR